MNRLEVTQVDGGLAVAGEIDAASVEILDRAIEEVDGDVVLDLSSCTFIDSTGVTALITADALAKSRGSRLVLVDPSTVVLRILEVCGMSNAFATEHGSTGQQGSTA